MKTADFKMAIRGVILAFGVTLAACGDKTDIIDDAPEPPKPKEPTIEVLNKPKAMCIDTEANFIKFARKENLDKELEKIKKCGLNLIYIDAKPSNGYALYKSDILPYCTSFAKLHVERDYDDFLGYVIEKCEELGIDVIASVNATCWGWTDGNVKQGFLYDQWDKWGDKVQVRGDNDNADVTIPITEDPLQNFMALDPTYPEVQQLIVDVCKELVEKYPKLKGISIDYLRYCNNDGGWFGLGERNMRDYAAYWGESVPVHTEMISPGGGIGPKFAKWIEYRSATVTRTLEKIRAAVKAVNPECELHMWCSAQWSSRYSVGQNWASNKYKPMGGQYTDTYNRTGFAHLLDVFVTGAYASTVWINEDPTGEWVVERFLTNWNDYIMGDCKCYGSIAAYALDAKGHADATYLCLKHTDGYMTFELSHINNLNLWNSILEGIFRYQGSMLNE